MARAMHLVKRIGLWSAVTVAVLVGLSLLAVAGLTQTDFGRSTLAEAVTEIASTPDAKIAIESLDGSLLSTIHINGLTIADRDGIWLRVPRTEIDWNIRDLWSRRLHVTRIALPVLDVIREPLSSASSGTDASPGATLALPLDIVVDSLTVDQFNLSPPVLGIPATFRISGRLGSSDLDKISTALTITRIDDGAPPAMIDFSADYSLANNGIALDASVSEDSGGLVAHIPEMPELPPISATFSGGGTLTDWSGRLEASAGALATLGADISIVRADDTRFRLRGTTTSNLDLDPALTRLLMGGLTFEIDGTLTRDRIAVLDQVRVNGSAFDLALDGRIDLANQRIDSKAHIVLNDPEIVALAAPGVAVDGLIIDVGVEGSWQQPTLSMTAAARGFGHSDVLVTSPRVSVSLTPSAPLDDPELTFLVAIESDAAAVSGPPLAAIAPLVEGPVTLSGRAQINPGRETLRLETLTATLGELVLTGGGEIDLPKETAEMDMVLDLSSLSGIDALSGLGVTGTGRFDTKISATGLGDAITLTFSGALDALRFDDPMLDAMLGNSIALSVDLERSVDTGIAIHKATVETAALQAEIQATLDPDFESFEATYRLSPTDMRRVSAALGVPLSGDYRLEGRIGGPVADPQAEGRVTLRDAAIAELEIARMDLTYTAVDLPNTPNGTIAVVAETVYGRADARTRYAITNTELGLTEISLESRDVRSTGALAIPLDGAPVVGDLEIVVGTLSSWLALFGAVGDGHGTGKLSLSSAEGDQIAQAELTLQDLTWTGDDETSASARGVTVSARARMGAEGPGGELTLAGTGISAGPLALEKFELEAKGALPAIDFRLRGTGDFRGPMNFDFTGRAGLDSSRRYVEISRGEGMALEQDITARCAIEATDQAATIAIEECRITFGSSIIDASGHLAPETVSANIMVDALRLASLGALLPDLDLEGVLTAEVTVGGPRGNPTGSGRASLEDVFLEAPGERVPLRADVIATWQDRRLELIGNLDGVGDQPASLTFNVPLVMDPERLLFDVPADQSVSGHLIWGGDLATVWPLLPLDTHDVRGTAKLDVRLAGSLDAPSLAGSATIEGGRYENLQVGTILEDLALTVDFTDKEAVLSRMEAHDAAKGRLSATGRVTFDADAGFPLLLELDITELAAVQRDDVTAIVDGRLSLTGSAQQAFLKGRIETKSVEVRIVDSLPAEIVDLNVVEINSAEGSETPLAEVEEKPSSGSGFTLALDLALDLPRRVFVRGRGLDSEWAGNFLITGTADAPAIDGQLTLVRGQLSILTKVFRLKSGSVTLSGITDVAPHIDIVAEHKASDATMIAHVAGPATNPAITLSSVPVLPRDEIVSRVLFGKKSTQLSPLEAAQLAAAVAELTGAGGGGRGVLGFTRDLIGVDVLRVDSGATGTGVEAGKYVADGVYVGVTKGLTPASDKVRVEVEIIPNVSIESETGATGESNIGASVKWDY